MNTVSDQSERISKTVSEFLQRYCGRQDDVPKWVLPPRSCEFLQALCAAMQSPVRAFEFGSGCSTRSLRTVCQSVVSVEDSNEWLQKTEQAPDAVAKRSSDSTFVVPLARCWNRFRLIQSFDLASNPQSLDALKGANFVLVDSPPNPAKREHALYQALSLTAVGTVIVADDLDVRATKRFCRRLARQNPHTLAFWHLPLDHELGIFLKLEAGSLRSRPGLRELVGCWMRV